MNMEELATYTGVCTRTCQRWVKDHGMPAVGGPRYYVIGKHEFLDWACRRHHVRNAITEPLAVRDIIIYHKAALYDLINS